MAEAGDDDELDLELDIRLRAPRVVGERLVVLAAVCRRGFLERSPETLGGSDEAADELEDAETERFDLAAWLRQEGLDGAATGSERSVLHARIGRLAPDAVARATWGVEALTALAWCCGLVAEHPTDDDPTDPTDLLALLPSPWDSVRPFLTGLALRSELLIAAERERAELWHWRAGVEAVYRQAAADERGELRAVIREVARAAETTGLLPALVGDDFSIRGRPVARLGSPDLDDLTAASSERLRAFNWVCGFGTAWDDVPTDV
ncbi:MAG: DUF4272 domain-containing protein [Chloroflexia bacterium]|nr:DUF4272 domain-containing protein [Chloroflexia bacterium]